MNRADALLVVAYVLGVLLTYGYKLSEDRRWYGVNDKDGGLVYAKAIYVGIMWPLYWPIRGAEELFKDHKLPNPSDQRAGEAKP